MEKVVISFGIVMIFLVLVLNISGLKEDTIVIDNTVKTVCQNSICK